ncbi:MAG: bifunctional UDP-N-acetylmuramoyl-tripeptide:D-alanyl-D-alanine ligase/alanine racemase [Bacteroidota bacterium]|nr:bifunctional UDP-N-acetylmuramoyl-tripeptide:D-alanyl-D-alanine ligase/alanine racemase [Bacteroidota bacterium]
MDSHHYSLEEVSSIIKGKLYAYKEGAINDILIDSRRLISSKSTLFFALKTAKNDGHKYVTELYEKGVRNFVISDSVDDFKTCEKANFITVSDTLDALQKLTAHHRGLFNFPVIGITGSNGKTIIKEWLYQLIQNDYHVVRSPKSYNSQIGVPLSVWQMNSDNDMGIFEAGISESNEMDNLQKIIKPNIGLFTNIGSAHDKNFISHEQKAGEKLKLFTRADVLIYNQDYAEIRDVVIRSEIGKSVEIFTWSKNYPSDIQVKYVKQKNKKTTISVVFKNTEKEITIPFTDDASIENAIHCWAVMLYLKYDDKTISTRMAQLQPIAMRLEMKEAINDCSIINDSYNSDLTSLKIALDFLSQQTQQKNKTLILSDITQSSRSDMELYAEIATIIEKNGISKLIGIGSAISSQRKHFNIETEFYDSTDDFIHMHPFSSFQHEAILIKGARVFEFEKISKALQQKDHETILEINLSALIHNLNIYRKAVKPGTKIMAMVKAFSYGSGGYEITNVLQYHNVDYLSVAYADEGVELRTSGVKLPIMVLNPDNQSFDSIIKHQLEPEIYSFRIFDKLEESIERNILPKNKPVKIHLKLDTGMKRLGFSVDEVDELIERVKANDLIRVQSVFSHLAASDEAENDGFTQMQIDSFEQSSKKITEAFDYPILRHILNSAGITRFLDAQYDMVRLGISLYGVATDEKMRSVLSPVSTLKSSISQIKRVKIGETVGYSRTFCAEKDIDIAVVPVGYADGLNRRLSNGNGHLIVNGKKASIIGNICMDMCMIDVTDIDVNEGDSVIIFGKDQPVELLAKSMGTIPYEVLTGISRRVKRVYYQE